MKNTNYCSPRKQGIKKGKFLFTLLAILCFSLISTGRCLAHAYAITSDGGKTVKFYNDNNFYTKYNENKGTIKEPRLILTNVKF